jgi:polar amino acid transport system substrate-binding protein
LRFTTVHDLARLASGSVTASLINVSKATMVASAVAVPELLSAANTISSERGNTGVTMTALLLTFLALIFCVVRLLRRLEALVLARYSHV